MSDLDEIAQNIVLLRKTQWLTQEELAHRSMLSVSRLQAIEYGCCNTTVDTLIRIAQALGINPRGFGIFSRPDRAILSEVYRLPQMSGQTGGELQICQNIVRLRQARELTQRRLAELSNVSIACLREVEHGCANASVYTLQCIARGFGLSLAQLDNLTTSKSDLLKRISQARTAAGIAHLFSEKTYAS